MTMSSQKHANRSNESRLTSRFSEIIEQMGRQKLPPVSNWHPARCGEIDIRIDANGTWFHEGREIERTAIAKVFSTILRYEEGHHYLVTPVEKLQIVVEDAPFSVVDVDVDGVGRDQTVVFRTNFDEYVLLNSEHPLVFREHAMRVKPYLDVRNGLLGLLTRSVYYRLAAYVEDADAEKLSLWSSGHGFALS